MADNPVSPRVHVLVVCDDIEPVAGESEVFNLIGVRTGIVASGFPYTHPQLCVYLQATGYPGVAALRIIAVHGDTDEVASTFAEQEIEFGGPLSPVPAWWYIEDCSFPSPGIYYFQVFCGEKLVHERQFHLSAETGQSNGRETG